MGIIIKQKGKIVQKKTKITLVLVSSGDGTGLSNESLTMGDERCIAHLGIVTLSEKIERGLFSLVGAASQGRPTAVAHELMKYLRTISGVSVVSDLGEFTIGKVLEQNKMQRADWLGGLSSTFSGQTVGHVMSAAHSLADDVRKTIDKAITELATNMYRNRRLLGLVVAPTEMAFAAAAPRSFDTPWYLPLGHAIIFTLESTGKSADSLVFTVKDSEYIANLFSSSSSSAPILDTGC